LSSLKQLTSDLDPTSLFESTFELNPSTGELKLLKSIDRELLSSDYIDLYVMAIDQAEPMHKRLNSTQKVTLRIVDVNDNAPKFEHAKLDFVVNVNNETHSSTQPRFLKISSPIDLIDLDSFETNSANFLNVNLNRAKENLFENAIYLNENIKYDDVTCFKSFNLDLIQLNSNETRRHPFLVMVQNEPDLLINYVNCKISIWLDMELLRQSETTIIEASNKYSFVLKADDYGLKTYPSESAVVEFDIVVNFVENADLAAHVIEIEAKPALTIAELSPELRRLTSAVKLTRNEIDSKIKQIDYLRKFRIVEANGSNRLVGGAENEALEAGVYLIDLEGGNNKALKQLELIVYDQISGVKEQQIELLRNFKAQMNLILGNSEPKFRSNVDRLSTLTQFQSLLFGIGAIGVGGSGAATMGVGQDRFVLSQLQNGTSMLSILLNNRSTFVKFISVTIVISFVVLTLFVCCILLIIRRNCAAQKESNDEENVSYLKNNFSFIERLIH
jgi:hypothetical protein